MNEDDTFFSPEHNSCKESDFADGGTVFNEGIQEFLTCEDFCDRAHEK